MVPKQIQEVHSRHYSKAIRADGIVTLHSGRSRDTVSSSNCCTGDDFELGFT